MRHPNPISAHKLKELLFLGASLGILCLLLCLSIPLFRSEQVIGKTGDVLPTDSEAPEGHLRILLATKDRAAGLSDVLMLLSFDREAGGLSILQIPRDTYVNFQSGSYRKINGAPNSLGGMEEFRAAMERSLGLTIDHYVRLGADAFREGVDALGGVELTLSEPMDYEDPAGGLSIHLKAGKQTLDGEAAEQFVRYRADYLRGDLGRLDAQKLFLAALAEKVLAERSPLRLARLAAALAKDVETDLSPTELFQIAECFTECSAESILLVTAPGEDVRGRDGGSYYVLSSRGMDELLLRCFGRKKEGSFDPDGCFLHGENKEFLRVYESYVPYRLYDVGEIAQSAIEIPRT